jgi:hypothetical protein
MKSAHLRVGRDGLTCCDIYERKQNTDNSIDQDITTFLRERMVTNKQRLERGSTLTSALVMVTDWILAM